MFYSFFSTCSFIVTGCQSGDKNTDEVVMNDSITATTDFAPVQKQPVQNDLEDPDTTDTIPPTAYGINTYGKQTVELVKKEAGRNI